MAASLNTAVAGFTGTRYGLTAPQYAALRGYLTDLVSSGALAELHHGECEGADAAANDLARALGVRTVGHPPLNAAYRAVCAVDERWEPAEYLARNRAIVAGTAALIAVPREFREVRRSGTWATVRYARTRCRPVTFIWPNGTVLTHPVR